MSIKKPFYVMSWKNTIVGHYSEDEIKEKLMEYIRHTIQHIDIQKDWGDECPPIDMKIKIELEEDD